MQSLSSKTKLAYGAGDLGAAITVAITGYFMTAFLLDVVGLRPAQVGVIFFISTLWDAITDPLMGNLSDRIHTRWGRRRPFLLFGAIPFGLAYFLHWIVPNFDPNGLFIYYLMVAVLLKTAFTIVGIPYAALAPELTQDYNERTRLMAYRFSFSILGGVIAIALHPQIVRLAPDVQTGHMLSAGIYAFFIAISAWITFAFTREPEGSETLSTNHIGFFQSIRIVFQNRPFLYVTGIYLLSWLTIQFVQANLLLFIRYWLNLEEAFTLMVLILQVTAFLFLMVWTRVSGRIGKKRTYYAGVAIWIVAMILIFFLPPGEVLPVYFVSFLAGIGISVAYLIPWSMLPDVIEYDELQTGERREGAYYGLFVFLQKVGLSLGLAVSGFVLDAAGYINPDVAGVQVAQPEGVVTVLRLFVSFIPVIALLLSIPFAMAYPITPERFAEIRSELAARKGELAEVR
jgi:glycoside/pentoside/hexuronide:cation symporter, GPH family